MFLSLVGKPPTKVWSSPLTPSRELTTLLNHELSSLGDVMTVNTEQVITGRKTFDSKITIHGNITMKENKTVDGVDVSELAKDAVYKNIPQNISGDKSFDALSVGNISISCKKACFFVELMNNLTKKTVKTDTPANITGLKTFSKKVFVSGKTIVDGYVNSMKVPDDLVLIDNPGVIHGKKTFKKVVDISGDLKIDGKMNDLNITDMYQNALHLDGAQTITGKKEFINGLSFGSNVNISGLLNGLKIPDDLVLVEADEEVSAHKIFKGILSVEKLAVDKMTVAGLIDGVNVTTLNRTIIKKVGNQVIPGDVTFKKGLTVRDNLVSGGNINGIDLKELDANAMKITGDQIVTGKKVIHRIFCRFFSPPSDGGIFSTGHDRCKTINSIHFRQYCFFIVSNQIDIGSIEKGAKSFFTDVFH